jgi:Mg-chelatase subunit ChlD
VVAAELRATFDPAGTVRIEEAPSQPSRFFTAPIDLPATSGAPAARALPAAKPLPCDARWSMERDGTLRLDGKLYRRVTRQDFERVSRPSATTPATPTATSASPAATASAEPAGGVDFFGARVKGRYVCFVCDLSGSMMGDKLEALKREIIRTVRLLPAGTHYQVVFFNDRAMLLQKGWTLTGTRDSEALLAGVDGVGCGGGTNPADALQYAFTELDPVPHELFLLTDGQFGLDPMPLLMQANGGPDRTRIHTLAMGNDADTAALQAIASRFGGTFTQVPAAAAIPPAAPPPTP